MKQTKSNSVCLFAVFVALLGLSACAEVASAQTRINIVHSGPRSGATALLLPIAQEQGLFTRHGLEVGFTVGSSDLVGKESQVGFVGSPAAFQGIARGADLKILGAFTSGQVLGHLVTRAEIKKPEDLRGKRFGVGAIGAGNWIQVVQALEHFGLEPKRDNISILSVGDVTQIAKALEAGTIDAAMLAAAQSSQMQSKGFSVLLDTYSIKIYGAQSVLVTSGAYLLQRPDIVEKVVTALVEAMAFSLAPKNKPMVLRTIMKVFNLTDPAAAERGYEDLSHLNRKPYSSIERLKNIQRIMALHDPKVLNLRAEDVIEDRFVRKLDDSGVIDRLYTTYAVK